MDIGPFQVEQLSEGLFRIFGDGAIRREQAGPRRDERPDLPDGIPADGFRIGVGPILVSRDDTHVLLDAGLGWGLDSGSEYRNVSNVMTNLEIFELEPGDIDHVVLTHLHYDHAAGCTWTDRDSATRATFPNARIHLQKREWEHAVARFGREKSVSGAGYDLNEFFRLAADGRLKLHETREAEIVPGIRAIRTGGHTPGHQVIRVDGGDRSLWYLGDLLPTHGQLNHYDMHAMDQNPLEAKKWKLRLLKRICGEQGVLLFYHSSHAKTGTLRKDGRQRYILNEKR